MYVSQFPEKNIYRKSNYDKYLHQIFPNIVLSRSYIFRSHRSIDSLHMDAHPEHKGLLDMLQMYHCNIQRDHIHQWKPYTLVLLL